MGLSRLCTLLGTSTKPVSSPTSNTPTPSYTITFPSIVPLSPTLVAESVFHPQSLSLPRNASSLAILPPHPMQ
ncbi:hypothetical protein DPEC_G00282190 [Dallia pectoralis]|uniref:Uncharacterized protein n=1 Tax=Dallia pectoralis TaxID=75939 RepID=A0ACC2FN40_DALPE|nr:hypothetical protein DPEC_G00282190 [Dallia pectoralis]